MAKKMGRPSNYERAQKLDLYNLCTNWLVENFSNFDKDTKLKIALVIAPRGIQQKVEHTGEVKSTSITIGLITNSNGERGLPDNSEASRSITILNKQ